jgi:hypothetical protein
LEIDISIRPASDERVRTLKALGGFLVGGSIAKVDDRRHVVDHLIWSNQKISTKRTGNDARAGDEDAASAGDMD